MEISKDSLNAYYNYDKNTGKLLRKVSIKRWYAGTSVGTPQPRGTLITSLFGRMLLVHRIIWIMHFGDIPEGYVIDHKDGNPANNKLENLRCVSPQENWQNRNFPNKGTFTGTLGVTWDSKRKKYLAQIMCDRKTKFLGRFNTVEEARDAYVTAKRLLHKGNLL